jgi:protein-S-isoprenylcysteine O-methyltransferase Ste14
MLRAQIALVVSVLAVLLAFGVRVLLQRRRYGDGGWRFYRAAWSGAVAQLLMVTSGVALLAAPVAALVAGAAHQPAGAQPLAAPGTALAWLGAGLGMATMVAGTTVTLVAQEQMGASWRIGVDTRERTALITHGLFRWVRNPIFTGMALVAVGELLLVPNAVAAVAIILGAAGLQMQVRLVEEPYLRTAHGMAFLDWAATSGRFLPKLGRL